MNFTYDLIIPNEQRLNLIQQYYSILNTAIHQIIDKSSEQKGPRGNRLEMKFYRLFSIELLDLALRFNVELDRIPMNIQSYQQQALPHDPNMVFLI